MKLAILLSSVCCFFGATLSATVVIGESPSLQTASLGSTAIVQIGISGLGLNTAPSLGAYDLTFTFNPAVLSFTGLTFGDPIQGDQLDLSGAGTISDLGSLSAGMLEFFAISLDPAAALDAQQSDHFVLATLSFKAIGAGNSSLLPTINSLADSQGSSLMASFETASIQVVATPEPNTSLLSLGVLLAFSSLLRKLA